MTDLLIPYTKKLISFESTDAQHLELRKCAEWIVAELQHNITHDNIRIELVSNGHIPSILAVNGQWKHPEILLNGHFDVVPGDQDQFSPTIDSSGDKLFGRGAADMKAGVASLMIGFIETVNHFPDCSLGIMLTGDEEIGGSRGVQWLVEEHGWQTDLLINFDGGYGEAISHAEKGIINFTLESTGKRAKSNRPWDGVSAVDSLIAAHHALFEYFSNTHIATDEDNWHSTYTVREIVTNTTPHSNIHHAQLAGSVYFTEDMHIDDMITHLKSLIPSNVTFTPTIKIPRVFIKPDHPEILLFQQHYQKHLGFQPQIRGENGSSDARFFVPQDIPMIITKPKSGNPEADGEWVSISSAITLTRALIDFLASKATA